MRHCPCLSAHHHSAACTVCRVILFRGIRRSVSLQHDRITTKAAARDCQRLVSSPWCASGGPQQQLSATHVQLRSYKGPRLNSTNAVKTLRDIFAEWPCLKLMFPRFKNKPPKSMATPSLLKLQLRHRRRGGTVAVSLAGFSRPRIQSEVTGELRLRCACMCVCVLDVRKQEPLVSSYGPCMEWLPGEGWVTSPRVFQ